jgi:Phage virion morphogenesis family
MLTIDYDDKELRKRIDRLSRVVTGLADYQLKLGTPVTYGAKHQLGDGVPQRKFLGVSEDDRAEIFTILDDRLANPPENGRQVWSEIGEALLLSTNVRWDEQIDPDGNPWKPNSRYTLEQKRILGRSLRVMESTTQLRRSINYQIVPS